MGGVCYRALTGDVPEDATDRVRHDPLVPIAQRCVGRVSAAFLSAVDWALSVDEGARPQSVGAWREAMGAAAEKAVVDAPSLEQPHDPDPVFNDDELQHQEQAFFAEVGHQPHPRGMYKGETDLHIAARLNLPVLTRSLLTRGAEVNVADNEGETPLHWTAKANASAVAKVLLENGAGVNAQDNYGLTPLHYAAENKASATAEVLRRSGGRVNKRNDEKKKVGGFFLLIIVWLVAFLLFLIGLLVDG